MTISFELYAGLSLMEEHIKKLEKHAFHPDYLTKEAFLQRSLNYAPYEIVLSTMFIEKFRYYLSKSKFRKGLDELGVWTPKEILLKLTPVIAGTIKRDAYIEKVHEIADGPYTAISTTDANHVFGHATGFLSHLIRQVVPHTEQIGGKNGGRSKGKVAKLPKSSSKAAKIVGGEGDYTFQKPGGLTF